MLLHLIGSAIDLDEGMQYKKIFSLDTMKETK